MSELQSALDALVAQGMTRRRAALAVAWANSQRGKDTGRDYSKPGHCGVNAEPVDLALTGETVAWLCPVCGVSWHAGDLPPGAARVIPVLRPRAVDPVPWAGLLLSFLCVVWVVALVGVLLVALHWLSWVVLAGVMLACALWLRRLWDDS